MINYPALRQARDGIKRIINESKEAIIIYRKDQVDNGFERIVDDPFSIGTPVPLTCRISHEYQGPNPMQGAPAGLAPEMQRYILVDHNTTIYKDETFEALGHRWKIAPVDVLKKFGGVIGYQAVLIDVETPEAES